MLERSQRGLLLSDSVAKAFMKGRRDDTPNNLVFGTASFILPLGDLGDGEVDLGLARGAGSATFTRATVASCRMKTDPYLSLPGATGAYASTPDSAAVSIVGDIDIRVKVAMNDWTPAASSTILAKFGSAGNRSYAVQVNTSGNPLFWYSTDGTANATRPATVATGVTNGVTKWLRVSVDVDDGAGNHVVRFYLSDDGVSWSALGDAVTTAGVISLFDGSAPLELGSRGSGTSELFAGTIHYAEVRNGIDGPIVAQFDPKIAATAATSFTSNTGEEWTINGTAYLVHHNLKKVASGVPRSHYLSSGEYAGYLVEGARTNLCLRSEEFDNASWNKTDTTITANAVAAPDGTTTADLLTEGSAGTAAVLQSATGTANVNHVFSIFVKAGNNNFILMQIWDGSGTGNRVQCIFDIGSGAVGTPANVGSGTGAAASIEDWGNGWYRCSLIGNPNGGSTSISFQSTSATSLAVSTRVNGATRYQWGAQFEDNVSFASSYIPTTTASVTRNADVLTYDVANASRLAGWGYVEHCGFQSSSNAGLIGINVGTLADAVNFIVNNGVSASRLLIYSGSVQQADVAVGSSVGTGVISKRAFTWGSNFANAALNGTAGTADTSVTAPTDATLLQIGANANAGQGFGTLKNIRIGTRQLADAGLATLTV